MNTYSYGENLKDERILPAEPERPILTINKRIPRIGDEIIVKLSNFGFENKDKAILNFSVNLNNMEYKADGYYNSLELQSIKIPHMKIEKYKNNNWINTGTDISFHLYSTMYRHMITSKTATPEDKSDFIITRQDILDIMKKDNLSSEKLYYFPMIIDSLGEDGNSEIPKVDYYNKLTPGEPIEAVYKVVDKENNDVSGQDRAHIRGHVAWQEKIGGPAIQKNSTSHWFTVESSTVSLKLKDEGDKNIFPGDNIDLIVSVTNNSQNVENKGLYAGYDFGIVDDDNRENILNRKTDGYLAYSNEDKSKSIISEKKANKEKINYDDSNLISLEPQETKEFEVSLTIPETIDENMLDSNGNLVITPSLFSYYENGDYDDRQAENTENEREHDEPLIINITGHKVDFDANGGVFSDNQNKKTIKIVGNNKKLDINNLENPTKEGYIFSGWYTDEQIMYEYDFDKIVDKDLTLYAKWEKNETSVSPEEPANRLSDTVVLASGYHYTDVLTATVLANEKKAPILLSEENTLTDETIKEIKRINPEEIIISGGKNSISQKVEDLLKTELKDISITRISGKDRYETAKNIGEKIRELSPNKTEALLVDGTNFPDVITMSTIASEKRAPILLTQPKVLNDTTKNSLTEFGIKDIIIGGGENSISKEIENNLNSKSSTTRYGGSNRYETASIVGKEYKKLTKTSDNLIVVDGSNYPDGITISSIANKLKSPILLTKPNSLPDITQKNINTWNIKNTIVIGGENSVNSDIYTKVKASERISGKDRYETAVRISQKFLEK